MTKGFTSKDIVSIIAACHKNRVKNLKWGDLSLDFDLGESEQMEGLIHHSPNLHQPETRDIEETLKDEDPLVDSMNKHLLLMEDPLEFERQMMEDLKETESATIPQQTKQDVYGR